MVVVHVCVYVRVCVCLCVCVSVSVISRTEGNSGTYECQVENSAGSTSLGVRDLIDYGD